MNLIASSPAMGSLITFQNGYGGGENDFHRPALVASCSCFKRG